MRDKLSRLKKKNNLYMSDNGMPAFQLDDLQASVVFPNLAVENKHYQGKTKDYSKSQYMLKISLRPWSYCKDIFNDINKFIRFKT